MMGDNLWTPSALIRTKFAIAPTAGKRFGETRLRHHSASEASAGAGRGCGQWSPTGVSNTAQRTTAESGVNVVLSTLIPEFALSAVDGACAGATAKRAKSGARISTRSVRPFWVSVAVRPSAES